MEMNLDEFLSEEADKSVPQDYVLHGWVPFLLKINLLTTFLESSFIAVIRMEAITAHS